MAHPGKNYIDAITGKTMRQCSQCKVCYPIGESTKYFYEQKKSKTAICYQSKCKFCIVENTKKRRKNETYKY